MKKIEINNIQAIEHISIPIPDGGGVVVLKGNQGTGKSTALQAVQALAGRKVDTLTIRDGEKRGTIECDGCKVVITKSRTARSGELAFEMVEGRFDLSKIVDPQILDPDRADAARIKQLLSLTAAKPNAAAYWALLRQYLDSEEIDSLNIDDETDDPVDLHKRFVAAMQTFARILERKGDQLRVDITELKERYRGLNIRTPAKVSDVREAHEECVRAQQRMEQRIATANKHAQDVAQARKQIDLLRSSYDGPTVDEAQAASDSAAAKAKAAYEAMVEAERQYKAASAASTEATNVLTRAKDHAAAVALAEGVLKQTTIEPPSRMEIEQVNEAVEKTSDLLEKAILANEGKEMVEEAEKKNFEADRKIRMATEIRDAAKSAETILAETLRLTHIRVIDGRLVTSTDRDENELFAELSHGERAILAIREAAKYVPPHGLCSVSQEIWGGISQTNKELIRQEARRLGIVILAAEVTDGELAAEVMP